MIQLLPPKAVCQALAISPRTLRRMKARGEIPFHTVAGRTRYNQADIELAIGGTKQQAAPEIRGHTEATNPHRHPGLDPGPSPIQNPEVPDFESIRRKAAA